MFSFIKLNFRFKGKKQPAMQNNSVNNGIFLFLGTRIWLLVPVYWYENPSEYITERCGYGCM